MFVRYGGRATTEECPVAVVVMSLQSIVGVVIQVYIIVITIPSVYLIVITITTHLCPGLHGWDSVCQVHQAHQQGSHHLVQQECPDNSQEWIFLPGSEAGRSEV